MFSSKEFTIILDEIIFYFESNDYFERNNKSNENKFNQALDKYKKLKYLCFSNLFIPKLEDILKDKIKYQKDYKAFQQKGKYKRLINLLETLMDEFKL